MKKLLLTLGAGLIVGLGVSTVASVYLPGRATLAERYTAEVVGEGSAGEAADTVEGSAGSEALQDDALSVADALLPGGLEGGGGAVVPAPGAEKAPATVPAAEASPVLPPARELPAAAGIDADRLAKLFGSMPARDAARVLDHLEDAEVRVILGKLGNREAAAILGSLEPERAALISRTVIRGEGREP